MHQTADQEAAMDRTHNDTLKVVIWATAVATVCWLAVKTAVGVWAYLGDLMPYR